LVVVRQVVDLLLLYDVLIAMAFSLRD
jgi:hypothetical protein